MDENRFERLKELMGQIQPEKDAKSRILENIIYRKRRKGSKLIKYAVAAAVFICILAGVWEMNSAGRDHIGLNVYASELDKDNWMKLPVGEKRQLSSSNETNFGGYTFSIEIPDGYECYYRDLGVMIGLDYIYHNGNVITWCVRDDGEFDFPDYMDTEMLMYLTDKEGNKAGKYRIVMSRENGRYYVELLDESFE